ncbi:MAG: hypothetical protein ACR2JO_07785 [Mycobacteriales bacterium]
MTIIEIPTPPGMGRSLIDHDPRNRDYPTRGVLHAVDAPLVEKTWRRGHAYDQGRTSQCVAFTGKGMLNTAPTSAAAPYRTRAAYSTDDFYAGAQAADEWPGQSPDYEGTSAKGLCAYLTTQGLITEYRWCFGVDDVLRTVSHHGSVGCGTWWSRSMFTPGERGLLTVDGEWIGGHEWEIVGVDPHREEVIACNSWSLSWGDRGHFRLTFADLDRLLTADGDAFTLVPA